VHEFGHFVLCGLLYDEGVTNITVAYTDAAFQRIKDGDKPSPSSQGAYINEGFADFFAGQVVGGTNYFVPNNSDFGLGPVFYCNGARSTCTNGAACGCIGTQATCQGVGCCAASGSGTSQTYSASLNTTTCMGQRVVCSGVNCLCTGDPALPSECLDQNSVPSTTSFNANVARVATLLHDAFDGQAQRGIADVPNDADLWTRVPGSSPAQLKFSSLGYGNLGDEDVRVPGSCMNDVLEKWDDNGNLLRESSFLKGLTQTALLPGCGAHSWCQTCEMLSLHRAGRPVNATPRQDFDRCVQDDQISDWLGPPPVETRRLLSASCQACPASEVTDDGIKCHPLVCVPPTPFRVLRGGTPLGQPPIYDCVATCPPPLQPVGGECLLDIP